MTRSTTDRAIGIPPALAAQSCSDTPVAEQDTPSPAREGCSSRGGTARGRGRPRTPVVGAGESPASSAGTTALKGAEWRAAVAAAQGKGRRHTPRATPAVPAQPAADGARITASAHCIDRGCPWTAGPGDAGEVDKAAEKHTTKPPKHPTAVVAELVA